jgi:HPt (histidine-containing phosphotransfer) domain-containing protein
MTANALAGDREACLAAGMDDYVSKPVRIEDLESALQRGLEAMDEKNSAPQSATLIDANALENLRSLRLEGEPDPLAELVELFIADTPGRIALLHTAVKNKAAHELEAAAHSLKGSASNLGAATIAARCAQLMQLARSNNLGGAAELVTAVEEDFGKVKPMLLEEVKR